MYYSQSDRPIAVKRYTLAVDRMRRKNQNGERTADFINCVAFDKAGEFAEKYFRRGMRVVGTGRIQTSYFINKDRHRVNTFDIMVKEQHLVEILSFALRLQSGRK